jgi:cytidylyltransferase domain protein
MILIHARGNEKIGIGNLQRCFELAKFLSVKYEVIGIFECDENLFKRYDQDYIFRSESYENSLKLIKEKSPKIYICDLLDADKNLSNFLHQIGAKIVHFNDLDFGFEPDILVVMDDFDYEIIAECKIYRGFKYYIVSDDILKFRPKLPKKLNNIQNILVSFGGSDPAFYTEHFVNSIQDSKYNYKFVLGPAMSAERKKHIKAIKKDNISFTDSPTTLLELILKSDILLTLGGMSAYEAMTLGVGVCCVRWSYLSYVVENFGQKNMISDLGNINESYENLLNLDVKKVNEITRNAYTKIDGNSLINIENIINNLISNNNLQ